ncbi:hypothetical protein R5W23_000626, partial [Gemmata sp. JC673]
QKAPGGNVPDTVETLFQEVRTIVRRAESPTHAVALAVAFAQDNPDLLGNRAFWDRVVGHDFRRTFETVVGWARSGMERLHLHREWAFTLLAVGDCPELFQLCGSGPQAPTAEKEFRAAVLREGTVGCSDLERCCTPGWGWGADHNVAELFDDVLSFSRRVSPPYHGSDGYFLWQVVASSALIAPLSDAVYRADLLQGCERLYLLSGSGDMYVYLATVTPGGVQFESPEAEPGAAPDTAG